MLSAPPSALKSMLSTSFESIVTLATSRKKQHPSAVGRDVDVLGDIGAVEQHRVEAGLAFDGVVVVARVPHERVVARAHQRHVVAVAAVEEVVALAAMTQVLAESAVDREQDSVCFQAVALMTSSPPSPLIVSRSFAVLVEEHVHLRLADRRR